MEEHDEDLSTTLVFVSFGRCPGLYMLNRLQAGLFSTVRPGMEGILPDP